MKNMMKVLIVEPWKRPYAAEIPAGLESLQKMVGGLIQAVYPFEDRVAVICNDEGKINGMELNRALYTHKRCGRRFLLSSENYQKTR